jgi:hypothetical protein
LDVSRWGRFQDIDLSAQFSAICKKNKKQVIEGDAGQLSCPSPALIGRHSHLEFNQIA